MFIDFAKDSCVEKDEEGKNKFLNSSPTPNNIIGKKTRK